MKTFLKLASLLLLPVGFLWAKPSLEVVLNSSQTTNPFGLAFDGKGNTYVAEYKGGRILLLGPDGKSRIFRNGRRLCRRRTRGSGNDLQRDAQFGPCLQRRPFRLGYPKQFGAKDRWEDQHNLHHCRNSWQKGFFR